jgi:16S rRNA (guanine966-N2)-methyltransferase
MRVIGGEFRSRVLKSLPSMDVRPTPDRLRETLFNILAPRIEGVVFLDAYAGTGAVGIEALSRGAARAIFIEKNRNAANVIYENLRTLGILNRAEVAFGKAALQIPKYPADIIFLDPPYSLTLEYEVALNAANADSQPLVIAQHSVHFDLKEHYGNLVRYRTLKQGENMLSFYRPGSGAS